MSHTLLAPGDSPASLWITSATAGITGKVGTTGTGPPEYDRHRKSLSALGDLRHRAVRRPE